MLMGKMNIFSHETGLGTFRSTRPLSNTQLARVLLKVGTISLFCSWLVTLVSQVALLAVINNWGDMSFFYRMLSDFRQALSSVELLSLVDMTLLTLLFVVGSWMNMAMVATVCLAGRNWLIWFLVEIPFIMVVVYVLVNLFQPTGWVYDLVRSMGDIVPWLLGGLWLISPLIIYPIARRLRLIQASTPWIVLSAWLATVFALALLKWSWVSQVLSTGTQAEYAAIPSLLGFLALTTTPPVLAPMALKWNRHR